MVEVNGAKYHGDCFTCSSCSKSLIGVKFQKEKGELLCQPCWVQAYAPTCAGCGEKIEGGVMTVTSADKSRTKTQWHKECFEKEKAKDSGKKKQLKKGPKKVAAKGLGAQQPFAHHLPPELLGCMDEAVASPNTRSTGGKKKTKKKMKAQPMPMLGLRDGDGQKSSSSQRLQDAFEQAAVRGGIVTIDEAFKNTQSLIDELAALEA